jgi:hypothetical protein
MATNNRFQLLESLDLFVDCLDVFLEDNLLRRCGPDNFREPSEVGRAPDGPARIGDVMSEPEGFETELGRFEVPQDIFAGSGEIANGFIFSRGNVDGCEITRAHQAGQLHSVPAVGFNPVARLVGNQ